MALSTPKKRNSLRLFEDFQTHLKIDIENALTITFKVGIQRINSSGIATRKAEGNDAQSIIQVVFEKG